MRSWCRVFCFVLAIAAAPAHAAERSGQREVDVALVLAVDVSSSVDEGEAGIQRSGYITALRDPRVAEAIRGGLYGRIALTYIEWSSPTDQRVVIPWREISDGAGATAFADELKAAAYKPGSTTSISGGIDFSTNLLLKSGFQSLRRVIDISGDGYSDYGRPVRAARDAAVKAGIIINGLPIMNERQSYRTKIPPDLDKYYAENVTGGRGSFTLVVKNLEDFNKLVLQKLILEIAQLQGHRPADDGEPQIVKSRS
ncbi:MAG: DUF1194 domain-containing protein [Rhodospirillaceae bacterium]|nr:DUF1194 domain-containing protein [Rhodospirillaceae bacterium]